LARTVERSGGLIAGRFVRAGFWEVVNHLGEIRMVIHSYSMDVEGGPVMVLLGPEQWREDLRCFVGFRLKGRYRVPALAALEEPPGTYVVDEVTGPIEQHIRRAEELAGRPPERCTIEFLVNPLDYPERMLRSVVYVPLDDQPHRLPQVR
jgi:hypothetical protein